MLRFGEEWILDVVDITLIYSSPTSYPLIGMGIISMMLSQGC